MQWCIALSRKEDRQIVNIVNSRHCYANWFLQFTLMCNDIITFFRWEYNGIKHYLSISILHTPRFPYFPSMLLKWGMGNCNGCYQYLNFFHFLHSAFSTLCFFYTLHFLHSAFSTLRIFYTLHLAQYVVAIIAYQLAWHFPALSFSFTSGYKIETTATQATTYVAQQFLQK